MTLKLAAIPILAAVALVAVPASPLALSGPGPEASATRTISVKDSYFSPRSVKVRPGTKLRFVWRGRIVHNVAVGNNIVIGNRIKGSGTRRVRGSVTYNCTLHRPGMKLKVRMR